MSRTQTHTPTTLTGLARRVRATNTQLDRQVSFGQHGDPNTVGEGSTHNIVGTWVKATVANGVNTFQHNLGVEPAAQPNPNVGWLVFGAQLAGDMIYVAPSPVTADTIELTWTGLATDVLLFFVPVGDW